MPHLGLILFGVACASFFFVPRYWPEVGRHTLQETVARDAMQVVLSLVLAGASLFVILSHQYDPNDKHWAYGTVGTVLGFWLRPK
jgi:hypothetical protein